jgi:Ti-type conjugative transfer relaxase TraA
MITRCVVGRGVTGAVRYILGEGRDPESGELADLGLGDESRVDWIGGINFGFEIETREDADLARRIMEFDALNQASRTKQCEKDCVHLALGWRPGEMPTREEMEAAAKGALKALGMENAKAIFAAHNDESYSHLHIVASKIDPATGRAYNLIGNYFKLSKWAQEYEREHGGIVCLRREDANRMRDAIAARDAGAVLEAMTEQRATFTAEALDRQLAKQIRGRLARAQFGEQVLGRPEAVKLTDQAGGPTTRYTSRAVLRAEQHVLSAAEALDHDRRHDAGDKIRATVLGSGSFSTARPEQVRAFREATGPGGLALIDGQAGTGKSYTMSAIRHAYEAAGCQVIGLAPTNAVAQDMQRDGFRRAATVHSELFALNNARTNWDRRTVVMVDEAAMLDTKLMAMVTAYARASGAKLILVGDDRQLSSIERGGMFGALKERYGAAALKEVTRQRKDDDRRATSMMAEGNFHDALAMYEAKGAITWTRTQEQARAALAKRWTADTALAPEKSRFVFAYTNVDVADLNADLRSVRRGRGELGPDHLVPTAEGEQPFARGDRLQFTGTDKQAGLYNGMIGTVQEIDGTRITLKLDGQREELRSFDAERFQSFRHGYAGTIYKGQGRTLDQTYLYHSEHWRSAASYVALTRHRDTAALFVARNTARDVTQLARQMARVDDRRAASHFHHSDETGPIRAITPRELMAELGGLGAERTPQQEKAAARRELPMSKGEEIKLRKRENAPPEPQAPEPVDAEKEERMRRFKEQLDQAFDKSANRDRGRTR